MPLNIVFICTGNTCRSPMAEGLLKSSIKPEKKEMFTISSAGLSAFENQPASEDSIDVMSELNIDISNHHAKLVDSDIINQADFLLTMSEAHKRYITEHFPDAKRKVFLLSDYVSKGSKKNDVPDPIGSGIDIYRNTRDEINEYILTLSEIIQKQ